MTESPRSSTLSASEERALLARLRTSADPAARTELIERMLPLVRQIARGYAGGGEPLDDLIQVGSVGLVKAIDRFDTTRGVRLSTYAGPTISGEIKRHLRDHSWSVRPPRDLQDRAALVRAETSRLGAELGRSPTVGDLATSMGCSEESVLDAIQAGRAYAATSLDAPRATDDQTLLDEVGAEDPAFERAELRDLVRKGLDALPLRERRIVLLYVVEGQSQREIAATAGISQMHVSRLLRDALAALRSALAAVDERS